MSDFQLNFSGEELNEAVQKIQELPVGPTDRDLSNLSGAGKQVIKTLAGGGGNGDVRSEDFYEAQVVIDTFVDGNSGYRIWSDGYCEQWGMATQRGAHVNFLKTFRDTNYSIVSMGSYGTASIPSGLPSAPPPLIGDITATSAYVYSSQGTCNYWRACGYLAEGEY